jgi:hypothetical protein
MVAHAVVRKLRLDAAFNLFQFNNPWYYLLYEGVEPNSGVSMLWAVRHPVKATKYWYSFWSNRDETVMTLVQATVEQAGVPYIYQGILNHFYFKENSEQLDRLVVGHAARRRLRDDDASQQERDPETVSESHGNGHYLADERWYNIHAHHFVIKYEQITDLSLLVYVHQPNDEDAEADGGDGNDGGDGGDAASGSGAEDARSCAEDATKDDDDGLIERKSPEAGENSPSQNDEEQDFHDDRREAREPKSIEEPSTATGGEE